MEGRVMNSKGFTLIEMLMVTAIGGIMSYIISSIIVNMHNSLNVAEFKSDVLELKSEFDQMTKSLNCGIGTLPLTVSTLDTNEGFELVDGIRSTSIILKSGRRYNKLKVLSTKIVPVQILDPNNNDSPVNMYEILDGAENIQSSSRILGQIEIKFEGVSSGMPRLKPLAKKVVLTKNPDSLEVVGCEFEAATDLTEIKKDLCLSMHGNWEDGECLPQPTVNSENSFYCSQTDSCGVAEQYILTNET